MLLLPATAVRLYTMQDHSVRVVFDFGELPHDKFSELIKLNADKVVCVGITLNEEFKEQELKALEQCGKENKRIEKEIVEAKSEKHFFDD